VGHVFVLWPQGVKVRSPKVFHNNKHKQKHSASSSGDKYPFVHFVFATWRAYLHFPSSLKVMNCVSEVPKSNGSGDYYIMCAFRESGSCFHAIHMQMRERAEYILPGRVLLLILFCMYILYIFLTAPNLWMQKLFLNINTLIM